MTQDMATDSLRSMTDELRKKELADMQLPEMVGQRTKQFRCGRCGKNDTAFHQMQTRSADEPMTTFVTCLNCDHRWRVRCARTGAGTRVPR